MKITLRDLEERDLVRYEELMQPGMKHHRLNGPYYHHKTREELRTHIEELRDRLNRGKKAFNSKKMIVSYETDELIGQVNWYWKSRETDWLEVGILIFEEDSWGKGFGTAAMTLWIDEIFAAFPKLVRIGLTTWSGNKGMMKLSEKIGFKKEAEYRNARIVDGTYYDSISYGIQKSQWENRAQPGVKALLIIDMQKGCFLPESTRFNRNFVVGNINVLARAFREKSRPVILIQHNGLAEGIFLPGTEEWELLDDLDKERGDIFIEKYANDSFCGSHLERVLETLSVKELFITGCATDFCVNATLQSAVAKGYRVTAVADGHTTGDRPMISGGQAIDYHNWLWADMIPVNGQVRVEQTDVLLKEF